MRFATFTTIFVVCGLMFPSFALAGEVVTLVPRSDGALLRSGLAAVQRLSEDERRVVASAQAQQTKLNNDKKTKIIVITVVAAAAAIYVIYKLRHMGPILSGGFEL